MTTEYGAATIWVIIITAAIGTLAIRVSFILLLAEVEQVPARIVGVLRFVPAAVLSALAVSAIIVLTVQPEMGFDVEPTEGIAGMIAVLIAWRTENVLATIGGGMVALWCLQAVL